MQKKIDEKTNQKIKLESQRDRLEAELAAAQEEENNLQQELNQMKTPFESTIASLEQKISEQLGDLASLNERKQAIQNDYSIAVANTHKLETLLEELKKQLEDKQVC